MTGERRGQRDRPGVADGIETARELAGPASAAARRLLVGLRPGAADGIEAARELAGPASAAARRLLVGLREAFPSALRDEQAPRSSGAVPAGAALLTVLLACAPEPRVPAPGPPVARDERGVPAPPPASASLPALPADPTGDTELRLFADRARAAGVPDLAAHLRGSLREPLAADHLEVLRDLVDAGRADDARALAGRLRGDPHAGPQVAAVLADLPPPPRPLDPALAGQVHAALAGGDLDRAAGLLDAALARGPQLDLLLWRADVSWQKGQVVAARRARARARGLLAGATPDLWVSDPGGVHALAWSGAARLALLRTRRSQGRADLVLPVAEVWDLDPPRRWRELVLGDSHERPIGLAFLDPDRLVVALGARLERRDVHTGARTGAVALPAQALTFAADPRSGRVALGLQGSEVVVHDAELRPVARFTLGGTTPSVRRIYTHGGAYHLDEPIDLPTETTVLAFAGRGERLAVGGTDGTIHLVDLRPGKPRLALANPRGRPDFYGTARVYEVLGLHAPPGGDLLAAYGDGSLVRWDLGARRPRARHDGACTADEYARTIAGPGAPNERVLADCGELLFPAAFAPAGDLVALPGPHGGLRLRDPGTGASRHVLPTMAKEALAFSPDGARLAAGAGDTAGPAGRDDPELWDPRDGRALPGAPRSGRGGAVVDVDPDARLLVVDGGRELVVWDTVAGEPRVRRAGLAVRRARLDPAGRLLALLDGDRVRLLELRGGRELAPDGLAAPARALAWAPAGGLLAVGGDAEIRVWNAGDGSVRRIAGPRGAVVDLAIGSGGHVLATSEAGATVRTFELRGGRPLAELPGAGLREVAVALAPDGDTLARLLVDEGVVHLHDARTGELLRELRHRARMLQTTFTASGSLVIAASDGVLVWHPARPTAIEAHTLGVQAGRALLAAGERALLVFTHGGLAVVASDGAPLLDLQPTHDAGWFARSSDGAVDDGGDGRQVARARVAAGPHAGLHPAELVWDTLAAPALLPRSAAGQRVRPPGR